MTDARVEVVARALCAGASLGAEYIDRFWRDYVFVASRVLAALDAHDRESVDAKRGDVDTADFRESALSKVEP